MTLRLVGMPVYIGTLPGLDRPWLRGEVREVPDESARYLLADFGSIWEVVAVAPAPVSPPVDRMVKSPRGR